MCGIAGLVYKDPSRPCEAGTVQAMRDVASYRGPDDAGLHVDGPTGLGHRRLSIIDLSGGHQPMADVSGRYRIVFNGEIYNYRQVRERLVAEGARFHSHSDTEVILQLYARDGARCVEAMNGMFAFAILDTVERTVFLARDRMGVKPLYLADTAGAILFGSEIKSLFASGLISPVFREDALAEYMLFRQVAGPDTLFRGVTSLPPGCTATIKDGRLSLARYWSPQPSAPPASMTYDDALQRFGELLTDSVRLRLISDVPVGTFCSGGVDSSLVTALAAQLKGESVNTYSVGFDEADFDESVFARQVANHCGTTHHELRVGNEEFSDLFPTMVWHNDEPLDFPNSVHIFALSRLSKQRVTVVLTGEGSDELFAGYPRYRIPGLVRKYRHVPAPLRALAAAATGDHRLRKLNRFAAAPADDALLYNASYQTADVLSLVPGHERLDLSFRLERLAATSPTALDPVSRVSLLDQETFLVGILHRQDKMSMAASIESRVPFMDYRIVEFANSLPGSLKVHKGVGKALVKDFARTVLPAAVVDRKKSGFGVPLSRWFRETRGLGGRLAALPDMPGADVFDRAALQGLVAAHVSGARDHSELLWTVLNVATWRDAFRC